MIDRIDDLRVAFYLRHQEMIESWTAVRRDSPSPLTASTSPSPTTCRRLHRDMVRM